MLASLYIGRRLFAVTSVIFLVQVVRFSLLLSSMRYLLGASDGRNSLLTNPLLGNGERRDMFWTENERDWYYDVIPRPVSCRQSTLQMPFQWTDIGLQHRGTKEYVRGGWLGGLGEWMCMKWHNVMIHIDNHCQYMTILVNFGVCNLIIYGFMNFLHTGEKPPLEVGWGWFVLDWTRGSTWLQI